MPVPNIPQAPVITMTLPDKSKRFISRLFIIHIYSHTHLRPTRKRDEREAMTKINIFGNMSMKKSKQNPVITPTIEMTGFLIYNESGLGVSLFRKHRIFGPDGDRSAGFRLKSLSCDGCKGRFGIIDIGENPVGREAFHI